MSITTCTQCWGSHEGGIESCSVYKSISLESKKQHEMFINTIDTLETIKKEDTKFLKLMKEKHGAATFCVECKRNTGASRSPFWHYYSRSLCENCAKEYKELLDSLKAYDHYDEGEK